MEDEKKHALDKINHAQFPEAFYFRIIYFIQMIIDDYINKW